MALCSRPEKVEHTKHCKQQRRLLEEYAELEEIPVTETGQGFWSKLKDKVTGG